MKIDSKTSFIDKERVKKIQERHRKDREEFNKKNEEICIANSQKRTDKTRHDSS